MKIQMAKYYKKTEHIVPLSDELTLIGEEDPLTKAQNQKGKDELFDEHGSFQIIKLLTEPETNYEYDVEKNSIDKFGEIKNARN